MPQHFRAPGEEANSPIERPRAGPRIDARQAFRSLVYPDFRLLVASHASSSTGHWMEQLIRGWLVYEMTDSVLLLGLVHAVRSLPLLFLGPLGGVLADRMDRKRQLMSAQLVNAALSALLATLIVTGLVEVWHVFATALLSGGVVAFQQPARQSLVPNTVPRSHLMNALALNSVVMNLTRTVGPAVAGVLVGAVGTGGTYYVQAGMYALGALWTAQLSINDAHRSKRRDKGSVWSNMKDGFAYIWGNQTVFALLVLSLLPIVLAMPYTSLLPAFAKDVYDIGPAGLGVLLAATGVGAIVGAALMVVAGDFPRKGWYLLGVVMAFGLSLVGFASTRSESLAVLLLGLAGFAQTSYRVVNQTLLHINTEDEYRGRVMSVYLLDRGMAPAGATLAGTLAALLGAPAAVALMGAATFLIAATVAAAVPRLRQM